MDSVNFPRLEKRVRFKERERRVTSSAGSEKASPPVEELHGYPAKHKSRGTQAYHRYVVVTRDAVRQSRWTFYEPAGRVK
jgi:hypothetical protein